MPGLIRRLWRIGAGTAAVVVILLAVAIGLVRLALVQVPEYRDQIQAWAAEALGWPVEIGAMDARLGWHGPELRFTDARVLTQDGERTLVVAATGSMRIDPWSLLRGRPRPGTVSLGGVALRIERTVDNRWRLLGEDGPVLQEPSAESPRPAALPPLHELPAGKLMIEDVRVEYEDLRRDLGAKVFLVEVLEIDLGGSRLAVSATGMLPEMLGAELAVSLVVTALDERNRPRDWSAGVSFNALNLPALGAATGRPERWPDRGTADGSLSAAADKDGLARIAGDLLVRDLLVSAYSQADAATVEIRALDVPYEHLGTAFEWTRTTAGWETSFTDLDVERAGRRWVSSSIALAFESDDAARRIEARADLLELDDLLPIAPLLPSGARVMVLDLSPAGSVQDLVLHVDFPTEEGRMPEIHLDARFERFSVAPRDRAPGLRNISGRISGDLHGGTAELDGRDSAFDLPWMFREPLVFDLAAATLEWSRNADGLDLRVQTLELANADASVTGTARLEIPADDTSPRIDIKAVARDVQLVAGPRYLPVGNMPPQVVEWLDAALLAGRVDEARVEFRGATREFPFRESDGLFRVEFELAEGILNYDAGWPNATGIEASVRFENEGLWAEVREARLLDVAAGPVSAAIPDLATGLLLIEGKADGDLAAFREFVLAADLLEDLLGAGLEPAEMSSGQVSADVDLSLPLTSLADARARVQLQIRDGVTAYGFLGEPLRDINARISIDNEQVTGRGVTATLAGFPLDADISVMDSGAVRIMGGGRIDASGLARVLRAPLDKWTSGEGDWAGTLQFPPPGSDAPLEFEIRSGLQGFAIDLPAPFAKTTDETRQLQVHAMFPETALIDAVLEWDGSLRIAARVDRSGPESVLLAVPDAVAGEPAGLVLSGAIAKLDLDEWLAVDWPADIEVKGMATALAGGRLLIGELAGPAMDLRDTLLDLSRGEDRWYVDLAAERVAGQLEIPLELYGDQPVTVRLERLWLDSGAPDGAASAEGATAPPDSGGSPSVLDPALVPPLDIEIEDLRFGQIRFGSMSARVLHEGDGFELIGLESIGDGFMIQAQGRSRLSENIDESHLGLRIDSDDVGATLGFMGFRRSMAARAGLFEADVQWRGGLRSDWLEAIEGNARISIRDGRLVGVEPGVGRVFGLLSIQALPRRLALDFKDVFGEGTSFDGIAGDFRFDGGNAFTDNLIMEGPAADMVVVGRTGLVARDYDQTAVIGAEFGRAFPVAGAVVGGPAVGAALFLLSEMFRKPFQAQVTYRLTGPWENPVIERVSAGSLAPAPAPAENPPPPESGPGED